MTSRSNKLLHKPRFGGAFSICEVTMGKRVSPQSLGSWGENYVRRELEKLGFQVDRAAFKNGDWRVFHPTTGQIVHYEVKTARKNKRGSYQATVRKAGHACLEGADYVLLIVKTPANFCYPYLIPCADITANTIKICSHPELYTGKWAAYRIESFADLTAKLGS